MDVEKLKRKIEELKLSIPKAARKAGIPRSSFYRKLAEDGLSFTLAEIQRIALVLGLNDAEILKIFLPIKSHKRD